MAAVISPTKELALQTEKVAAKLTRMVPSIVCGSVAGGEKPKSEKARLRKGLTVLCATPGRLAYHLENTAGLVSKNFRCLVLDEADRLLDMGFEPQVRKIHKRLVGGGAEDDDEGYSANQASSASGVQTFLVSATLVPAVRHLATFCLRPKAFWADPEALGHSNPSLSGDVNETNDAVSIGSELTWTAPATLTQYYCVVPSKERLVALIAASLTRAAKPKKAIIFFSTGQSVDYHLDLFMESSWPPPGGVLRKKDAGPKIKKLAGRFIGSEESERLLKEDEDMMDDEDESEEETDNSKLKENADESESKKKIFESIPLFKLHGSLDKEERAGYIADFAKADGGILLASDAASRGLDFPQIDWIIQYDPPQRPEEYLHRVGRTARIGRAGNSLIFLNPSERGFLDVLRDRGLTNLREMGPEELLAGLQKKAPNNLLGRKDLPALLSGHLCSRTAEVSALAAKARSAFLASMKAYRGYSQELRPCFPFQQLHTGHLATSFALREAPGQVARQDKFDRGGFKKKGKGKGKGDSDDGKGAKGKGKGKIGDKERGTRVSAGRRYSTSAASEFAS
eukprot:TRINITY_DN82389_c0_g1_i1.p1 TRINITY_DN82389_c0_g1~~TRINITY_DN82389_c0_g1_i1.p1  ORF type:complete len:643 (-),score=146.99 TRINITY_DN82389_c0_g1_i1:54-1760(-)